ncbi:MAG: hypothetical protein VYA34_14615 [Myxococcota bacterium]|nr:hypothetical protein [Myxococcota bacterium]
MKALPLEAEFAPAASTAGNLFADAHVYAISSAESRVPRNNLVRSY